MTLTLLASRRRLFQAAAASAVLLACRPARAEAFTLRLNLPGSTAGVFAQAAQHYAAAVNRRSKGQLQIEVYPSLQLATEQQSIDGMMTGALDLTMQGSAFLIQPFPEFQVFDLPFMFKNEEAGFRVLDGPIGNRYFRLLETKGIVGLAWGTGGFKQLDTTAKPITTPDDMRGLRFRIANGPIYVATYQALGAVPVAIDYSEIFTALSQHTVDGIDLNIDGLTTGKLYTLIRHVGLSNHIFSVVPLMGSKRKLDTLPPALVAILKDEGRSLIPFWRSLFARNVTDDLAILKQNGVSFTSIDYPAFRRAVDPVYATFKTKLGSDLVDRVSRAAGN